MKIINMFLIIIALGLASTVIAEQADDPDTFQVETITMKFNSGKDVQDLLSLRGKFSEFAKAGDIKFSSRILVPRAVSKAALPDNQDWDPLWVGFSPNTQDYANAVGHYLEHGDSFNADFDEVRTNVSTALMGVEAVFRSVRQDREMEWARCFLGRANSNPSRRWTMQKKQWSLCLKN